MLDFEIKELYRRQEGFCVAVVLSYHDQQEYTLHNRFGSWMIGDPVARTTMREAAVISRHLAEVLQHRVKSAGDKLPTQGRRNPFLEKKAKKPNPFIAKAAKTNPFIAKALAEGKIG